MNRLFLTALATVSLAASASAQSVPADSAAIYFRQSKVTLLPDYKDNEASLHRLATELTDSSLQLVRSIRVVGSASPEGSAKFNHWLSQERADRIFNYFSSRNLIDPDSTSFTFTGRNWVGLRQMVESDPAVPARQEVLDAIDSYLSDSAADGNDLLRRLKQLDGGRAYLYMYHHLFPALRFSTIYVDFASPARRLPRLTVPLPYDMTATALGEVEAPAPSFPTAQKPFYMALKTNMLYDVLALPSIGAEFYLGRNFSIVGNWTYGWWDSDHAHRYWRAYGGDIALRWWFGRAANEKPLTGHHIGIFGGVLTYDFEFGGEGYMGGRPGHTLWDRCQRMAGVEYGYSLPVGRRLNIDFTLGLGYLGGKLVKYDPQGSIYVWKSTSNLKWFGPVKAEISLVWLIGRGNCNEWKGGNR